MEGSRFGRKFSQFCLLWGRFPKLRIKDPVDVLSSKFLKHPVLLRDGQMESYLLVMALIGDMTAMALIGRR